MSDVLLGLFFDYLIFFKLCVCPFINKTQNHKAICFGKDKFKRCLLPSGSAWLGLWSPTGQSPTGSLLRPSKLREPQPWPGRHVSFIQAGSGGGLWSCTKSTAAGSTQGLPGFWLQDWASLVVKNLPANASRCKRRLSWEDPLEEGMATHPSILAWRIPWIEVPGGLQSMGL